MSLYLAVFGKPRYLGLVNIGEAAPRAGRWIVVKTVRGMEMALLGGTLSTEQEAKYRSACLDDPGDEHTRGPEPMLQEVEYVEPASDGQLQEHRLRRSDEDGVLVRSRQILHAHALQMKLVDVEYTMDRKKLFFYFTSEQRIDFRAYVRDLAKEFHIRIEMRQIGVRDEAKTVWGIAPCGRPCCCSYWLHRFTPINIRMVKEQNLALNPTKISGICGRLMCCMCYEHPTYSEFWKSLPSPGSKIKTSQGNYVLESMDLNTESVRIRFPDGREVPVAVAEFAQFKETVLRGDPWEKNVSKEPEHRIPPPQRPAHGPAAAAKTEESPKASLRNGRKNKPEKISLEEHIAGRSGEKTERSPNPAKTEGASPPEARPPRHTRRHKGGTAGASPAGTPAAGRTEEAKPRPQRRERPRPAESAETPKDARKGARETPRHRHRPPRGEQGRDRRNAEGGGNS